MSNTTRIWATDLGYALRSACVVPSHAFTTGQPVVGFGMGIDAQARLAANKPATWGARTWSPPLT